MAGMFRMQDLTEESTNTTQQKEDAIDIGAYNTVVVQVRVPAAATAGDLQFEEAMVNDNAAYQDVGPTIALDAAGNKKLVITDPMRFLRWKTTAMNGTAKFIIDVIGRV